MRICRIFLYLLLIGSVSLEARTFTAVAAGLDPGLPFEQPTSILADASGALVFATGRGVAPAGKGAVAFFERDPDSGALAQLGTASLQGAPGHLAIVSPGVLAATTSQGLELGIFSTAQGQLFFSVYSPIDGVDASSQLAAGPGGELWITTSEGLQVVATDGFTIDFLRLDPTIRNGSGLLFLDGQTLLVGGAASGDDAHYLRLLRLVAGSWSPVDSREAAGESALFLAASPNRQFTYVLTQNPQGAATLRTFEIVSGFLNEVAARPLDAGRAYRGLEVHPADGRVLLSFGLPAALGGSAGIEVLTPSSGGRNLFPAGETIESYRRRGATLSGALLASADGRHLYGAFEHRPLALFELDPTLPEFVPGGLGLADGLAGPRSLLTAAAAVPGVYDVYATSPFGIHHSRWNQGALSHFPIERFAGWATSRELRWSDLALSADGRVGVVAAAASGAGYLVPLDRDRASGELSINVEAAVTLDAEPQSLALSPDGRYLHVLRAGGTDVYSFSRDPAALAFVERLPYGGRQLRFSPDGRWALLAGAGDGGEVLLFQRNPASGNLSLAGPPAIDGLREGAWADAGTLVALTAESGGRLTLRTFNWQDDATPEEIAATVFPWTAAGGDLAIDPDGRFAMVADSGGSPEFRIFSHPGPGLPFVYATSFGEIDFPGAAAARRRAIAFGPTGNEILVASETTGELFYFRRTCDAYPEQLSCAHQGRFRVEIDWRDPLGNQGPGILVRRSQEASVFYFFDGRNWEALVKVLDGCSINDRFWVFAAATTDVAFELRVTDTWSGQQAIYRNAAGQPAPAITDSDALAVCGVPAPLTEGPQSSPFPAPEPIGEVLQLGDFEARVTWRTATGGVGPGQALGIGSSFGNPSGVLYFFSPNNWEMMVKVLDGCAINGHYWVFAAATTDVGFTLEVRNPGTEASKTYENPIGRASPAIVDLTAFACP